MRHNFLTYIICLNILVTDGSLMRMVILSINDNYSVSIGTTHSVRSEEEMAFADWINSNLGADPDVKHLLPLSGKDLYQKITDGILIV